MNPSKGRFATHSIDSVATAQRVFPNICLFFASRGRVFSSGARIKL